MLKIELLELLQQDIKGILEYEKYGLKKEAMKNQARGIILNLQEHLEEFIQQ